MKTILGGWFRFAAASVGLASLMLLGSCSEKTMEADVNVAFTFTFEGQPVQFDSVEYTIASGQVIRIDNIQYFISDLALVDKDGKRTRLYMDGEPAVGGNGDGTSTALPLSGIHYIDSDIASSLQWNTGVKVPTGVYEYVEFVYGIDSVTNQTGIFRNPPESLMFWPEYLGGGYHYMKLNGYWRNQGEDVSQEATFNFHAGIGQTWQGEGDDKVAVAFHQNYVPMRDTLQLFITEGSTKTLTINMEVANWFRHPHTWDFEVNGTAIMQNQQAQQVVKENACDVFSVK